MDRVVMFSGGIGSWYTAKRVVERHGTENLTLMFADTKMEDPDLYRFIEEAAKDVGGQLDWFVEGRNPWQVFHDVRFLGNTRIDPCSRILKRTMLRKQLEANYSPSNTIVYLGIDWSEEHRFEKAKKYWEPWQVEAPLCEAPYIAKHEALEALESVGIKAPDLYELGFPHNNCGGFCIKAGQAHFKLLFETMPERYLFHEEMEQGIRDYLNKDVAIMRDRRGGKVRPLTLREFRHWIETGNKEAVDKHEWGGCACFTPDGYLDD